MPKACTTCEPWLGTMTSPLDEELAEKWLPQATRKPIETRTRTARSQVNRLHILGLISIFACLRVSVRLANGSSALFRRRESPTFVYQECARRANPTKTCWNRKRRSELPETPRR